MKQFNGAKRWLKDLDAETAGRLLTMASDVALVVSNTDKGLICDISFGSDALPPSFAEEWLGKPWVDTVTSDSRGKVEALLRESANKSGAPRWRIVNHQNGDGPNLPIMYAAMQVQGDGPVVAFGRSMQTMAALQQQLISTQQSMEREFLRVRQAEARHRLLFQVASEAVLIVDAVTRKIIEANPAAGRLLGGGNARLVGRLFPDGFDEAGTVALHGLLGSVGATGRTSEVTVKSADGDREFITSASLFREERSSFFLIRLASPHSNAVAVPARQSKVMEIVEGGPEGFVVTDLQARVLFANRAFLDLAQLATEEQVRNESLERWLGRSSVDFNLLTAQLREHGSLRLFATQLRGEYGSTSDVEICAVSVAEGDDACFGFTIRDVSQRAVFDRQTSRDKPRSIAQLTELVGRVPLKDLVRESTDMIEKLCIEAALEITGDNRASAAEILGLSRQSLYAKLRRYGLGELSPADVEPVNYQ